MVVELRIASGLHRGATLPLENRALLIGANEDADVVLVDPGMASRHATLSQTDSGWVLCAEDGIVRGADSNQPQPVIDLTVGSFARVGDVWLMLSYEHAEWENPPAEPADDGNGAFFSAIPDTNISVTSTSAETATSESPVPAATAAVAPAEKQLAKNFARRRRLRPLIALPLLGVAVISAAYAFSLPYSQSHGRGMSNTAKAPTMAQVSATALKRVFTQEDLQKAFRQRLTEAELIRRFDLTLEDQAWSMQASLDDEETARFERVLRTFLKEYHVTFPVNVKIGSDEAMLPFRIMAVTTGANASMVTEDGQRLYVGDQYKGVRMVAINERTLVFSGKRKIVVNR